MAFRPRIAGAFALIFSMAPAFADDAPTYTYLALGDSIAFGLDPTKLTVAPPNASQFEGYPTFVAKGIKAKLVNAACPGETSSSFVALPILGDLSTYDLGCNNARPVYPYFPPFKPFLHTSYTSTQLAFAISESAPDKSVKLVTIGLGGNDLSLLQINCSSAASGFAQCVQTGLPQVIQRFNDNLSKIISDMRANGYLGPIVLVTNYSPVPDPTFRGAVEALNSAMRSLAAIPGIFIADGFKAFDLASKNKGLDPCAAKLLISVKGAPGCDIHPSERGQKVLADAVLDSIKDLNLKKKDKDDDE